MINPDVIEGVLTPQDVFNLKVDTQARWDRLASVPNDLSIPAPNFPQYNFDTNPLNTDTQLDITDGLRSNNPQIRQAAKNTMNDQIMNNPAVKYNTGFHIDTPYDEAKKYYGNKLGFDPTRDNEQFYYENTYKNKSWFNRRFQDLSKGTLRYLGGVVAKLGQTVGYLGSMVGYGIAEIFDRKGNNWMQNVADNALSNWFLDQEDKLKQEWIPIFKPSNWDQKGFFERLGNGQFWSDDIADGAAFMSEMILTSLAGGELGKIGYLGKIGRATIGGTSAIAKIGRGAMLVGTGSKNFGEMATWALNVAGESAFEASQGYKDIVKNLTKDRSDGKNNYTDDEIRSIAGDRSATRFRGNMLALGLSNAFENRFIYQPLLRKLTGKKAPIISNTTGVNVSKSLEPEEFLKATTRPEYKGAFEKLVNLRKKLNDPTGALRFYGTRILATTGIEGFWEENVQLAMERLSNAGNLNFTTIGPQLLNQTGDALTGKDRENEISIGLGGLLGTFGVVAGAKWNNERRNQIGFNDKMAAEYNAARARYLDIQNVYQKDDKGNFIPDGQGGYKVDVVKMQGVLDGINAHMEKQVTLDDVKNPIARKLLQDDLLTDFVYTAKKAGIFDVVHQRMNQAATVSPQKVADFGLSPETKQNLPQTINSFNKRGELYDETFNPAKEVEVPEHKDKDLNELARAINEDRKKTLFSTRAHIEAMDDAAASYSVLGSGKILEDFSKSGEAVPASSVTQLFNSLQWQKVKLLAFIGSLPKDSSFYNGYFDKELKRLDAEIAKIEPTVQDIADQGGVGFIENKNGQKVLVSHDKYQEYINNDGTIKKGKEKELFEKFEQDNKDFVNHAELKNAISQNSFLEGKISDPNDGYKNYLDYRDHLTAMQEIHDGVDDAIKPQEPLKPVDTAVNTAAVNNPAAVAATNPAATTEAKTSTQAATSLSIQKANVGKLMIAIRNNDKAEIDRLSTLAKAYDPQMILKIRDSYVKLTPGYVAIADKIDEVVKNIVGSLLWEAHINPSSNTNPLEKRADEISKKLDALHDQFIKNGKTQEEADSLALASLTDEERQVLRDSYNKSVPVKTEPTESEKIESTQEQEKLPEPNIQPGPEKTNTSTEPVTEQPQEKPFIEDNSPSQIQRIFVDREAGKPTVFRKGSTFEISFGDGITHIVANKDDIKKLILEKNPNANDISVQGYQLDDDINKNRSIVFDLNKPSIEQKSETSAKEETPIKEKPTISEAAKNLANKIRSGKINKLGGFKSSTGFDLIWDAALEIVAKVVETTGDIAQAIKEGLDYIRGTDWYKGLDNQKEFDDQFTSHLEKELGDPKVPLELQELPPTAISEIPTVSSSADTVPGFVMPAFSNYLSELIDRARRNGEFFFDAIFPRELEMDGDKPVEKDGRINSKSMTDPILLRHRNIVENIAKEIANKQDTEPFRLKIKLEILNDKNKDWFYKRDEKSNSVIAVVVDEGGEYVYFDNKGNETAESLGTPFGFEYEDSFYQKDKLNQSRNSLGKVATSIKSEYNNDPAPYMTVVSLLHSGIPVYGSIKAVTAGKLGTFDNNNKASSEAKDDSQYKKRTIQELIDAGEIEDNQNLDVRVNGYYLDYHEAAQEIQRTKIGNPMLYDVKSDLYIPLTGKKLKDITFKGTPISKDSQLYTVLETLDKRGEVSLDTRGADGNLIFGSLEDIEETYKFLKEILYSGNFNIRISGNTITLSRNPTSSKAESIWNAEINYVIKKGPNIEIPLSTSGEHNETAMSYKDFLYENFTTGAAKVNISKNDTRFAKVNKRVLFELDKNYSQLREELSNSTTASPKAQTTTVEVGDKFAPSADLSKTYHVIRIEDDNAVIKEDGTELEQEVNVSSLQSKWIKLDILQRPPKPKITEAQEIASKKIGSLPTAKIAGKYRVTGIIRPAAQAGERSLSPAIVIGNAIDYIAKAVFEDRKVSPSEQVTLNNVKSPISAYFKSPAHLNEAIKHISRIKHNLIEQGYTFKTGIRVYDKESDISGEVDVLLIDPQGLVYVADFKTTNGDFNETYMGITHDGVNNREYFATQGYLYGLMLKNQTGLQVADSNKIIGLNISHTDEQAALDTKIVLIRDATDYVFNFPNTAIVPFYQKNGKPMGTIGEIVKTYEELRKQNAITPDDAIAKLTGKKKKGDGLLMTIADVNLVAATEPQLKAEVAHMSEMFGEEFVVKFVNAINKNHYGEWNQKITTLYKNAIQGTVYHEGWHHFSQLFLTPEQKVKMYKSLRDQHIPYNDRTGEYRNTSFDDDLEIEEMLADEWVKFVQDPKGYQFPRPEEKGILGLFKKMWRAIKEWWSGTKDPVSLFKGLYNGKMRYSPRDINNAIWGELKSSIMDDTGKEILNHARTNLYIRSTSGLIGNILDENNLSPTWLVENLNTNKLKDLIWDKYRDQVLPNRISLLADISLPATHPSTLEYILANPDAIIAATVKQKGLSEQSAAMIVGQIQEINTFLTDDNGAFDNFYDYYVKNSDIEIIRNASAENLDLQPYFDADEINDFDEDYGENQPDSEQQEEDENSGGTTKSEFGKGPNQESAIMKSSKKVQAFFMMQGIVSKAKDDGTYEYETNELGLPETYNYATIFNKTKNELEGISEIEDMLEKLSRPSLHQYFPQARLIYDKLQNYLNRETTDNFSFLQDFRNVMSLPEVNNVELVVNFDVAQQKAANKDTQRTIIKADSISRIGEAEEVRGWEYSFRRPSDSRPASKVTDDISISKLFNDRTKSNILYNIGGSIMLNPFFDYNTLRLGMSDEEFLGLMGIKLDKKFWQNSDTIAFAKRVKDMFINNLERYKTYVEYEITDLLKVGETLEDFKNDTTANRPKVEELIRSLFLGNPIQSFRERKSYRMGDKKLETFSLFKALEDLSRQNAVYSSVASSTSFMAGDGKTKWPFYDWSLITYRTQMLNNVQKLEQFNDNIEYAGINPNVSPWLRNSIFYEQMFDDKGERRVISGELKNNDNDNLSSQKVKIELADLSSYTTIRDRGYKTVHPKNLSAQDKMFFDTVMFLTNGLIEVPRTATSSTMFAIRLNSYGQARQGAKGFTSQFLPIDLTGITTSVSNVTGKIYPNFPREKFTKLMGNYLSGELQKLRWYFDSNPEHRLAKELNIFKDILSPELTQKLITEATTVSFKSQEDLFDKTRDIVSKNKEAINSAIREYFATYITDLYKGKENSNYNTMSSSQKTVLKTLLDLYQNRVNAGADAATEEKIKEVVAERDQQSAHQTLVEKTALPSDTSLTQIAAIFALNQFILNVEYHTWYMGDNYLFSNPFKRGNLTTTTGLSGAVSTHTNHMLNKFKGETLNSLFTGNTEPKDYREIKTKVITDVVTKSRYLDNILPTDRLNYEKQFNGLTDPKEIEAKKAEITKELSKFGAISSADGQAKVGLDAYRSLRKVFGTWDNNKDEKEYKRQIAITRLRQNLYFKKDGDSRVALTGAELDARKAQDTEFIKGGPYSTFSPQKWVYTGAKLNLNDSGGLINSPMETKFDKMSLQPIIPEAVLGKGLGDEKLLIEMAMDDIDYVKFESATKGVKHDSISTFYDEFGDVDPNIKLEDASPEWLLSSGMRRQQPTDDHKNENTLGSQQRVMVFDVKYLPEISKNIKELAKIERIEERYLDALDHITSFERQQLLNRFGLKETGAKQTYRLDIDTENNGEERFAAAINFIARSNNFPENMLQYLQYNPSSSRFEYNPSLVFNRKMLLDNIGGIIDRQLRRVKTKGVAAIQVTSVGNTKHPYTNPTEDQIRKYGTNGLHFYHYEYDSQGNITRTSTMGIKITLQGDFKNLLNIKYKGSKIGTLEKLNEALKDDDFRARNIDKLTFYGYRIPTSNNNFIDHVEIMEFIPESAGNIIISPMEQITKSGSDFDVDKMQLIFPSIDIDGDLTALQKTRLVTDTTTERQGTKKTVTTSTRQVTTKVLPIEELYKKFNTITNSVEDYRARQKSIKNFITAQKKDIKKISVQRGKIRALIAKNIGELDPTFQALDKSYKFQRNDLPVEVFTMEEVIEQYNSFITDNEKLKKLVVDYERHNELMGTNNLTEDEKRIDHDFKSLMQDLNKYKDFYTNEMIEALKDVMKHPAYLKMLTTPSTTEYMTELANRIGEMTGRVVHDNLSSSENMKYTTVNSKHGEYLVDAKDIGGYSVSRRWFSLFNFTKTELNKDWKYGKNTMRIKTPLASAAQRSELEDFENIKLYGDNLDGVSPRDIWDQLMSLTIDLPTSTVYTQFGISNLNKAVFQYLVTSRYSAKTVIDFINQPIMLEVYNLYNKKVKEYPKYTLKHAMMEIADKTSIGKPLVNMYIQNKTYKNKGDKLADWAFDVDDKTGIKTGPDIYVKHPGVYATTLLGEDEYFDPKDLAADITTTERNTAAYKERQARILLYFMTAHLEATNFKGMQFTFSEDRNKNTNYFTIEDNNLKKEAIRGGEYSNLPADGSMFTKEPLMKLESRSVYSMFTYSKIAQLFYKQFAKEFTTAKVTGAIMRILDSTNAFGTQKQVLAQRIEGDFIEYIYKNFSKFNINSYNPFTDKLEASTQKFGDHFINRIFNPTRDENFKSYGDKLVKFLERYPELEERVEFVKRLNPQGLLEKNKKDDKTELFALDELTANVIRFKRSKENTIQERNFFANQFKNLITFDPAQFGLTNQYSAEDKVKIGEFFTELAYLTLYQSGPTNVADNFSDLLPADFWQEFSTTAFENYNKAIETGKIRENDVLKLFRMMYTINNPKVPWKDNRMIYNLTYFGETLANESDRKIARQYRKNTEYFLNFTAGKFYDMQLFSKEIDFKMVDDLTC